MQGDAPRATSAIAPDTTGLDFYAADPSLPALLDLYLTADLRRHIEPHLSELGQMAGGRLDACARLADRHPPVLHQRNRFGDDEQWIEYHPAYRELEAAGFGRFGIHAMSHRGGIMGWPRPYPAAAKLADVVRALNTLGATPQDLQAILQAMKSAGALNAEIEVI